MNQQKYRDKRSQNYWFYELAAKGYTKLEYEKFKELPAAELTDEEQLICQNVWGKISRKFGYLSFLNGVKQLSKPLKQIGKWATAVLLVISLLFGGTFLGVSAFRIKVLNFFLQREKTHSSISVNDVEGTLNTMKYYAPTKIPVGYAIADIQKEPPYYTVLYENSAKESIVFLQAPVSGVVNYDTEGADIKKIVGDSNQELIVVSKMGMISIIWYNTEYMFTLEGNLSEKELIEMSNSTKLQD